MNICIFILENPWPSYMMSTFMRSRGDIWDGYRMAGSLIDRAGERFSLLMLLADRRGQLVTPDLLEVRDERALHAPHARSAPPSRRVALLGHLVVTNYFSPFD